MQIPGLLRPYHLIPYGSDFQPTVYLSFHCRFTKTLDIHDLSNNLGFADNGTTPVNVLPAIRASSQGSARGSQSLNTTSAI